MTQTRVETDTAFEVDLRTQKRSSSLPSEWASVGRIVVPSGAIDAVVIGPNGVFCVEADFGSAPILTTGTGLRRAGAEVVARVDAALQRATELGRLLAENGLDITPHSVIATASQQPETRVGRLTITPRTSLAETMWRHPGEPLSRSRRALIGVTLLTRRPVAAA